MRVFVPFLEIGILPVWVEDIPACYVFSLTILEVNLMVHSIGLVVFSTKYALDQGLIVMVESEVYAVSLAVFPSLGGY